MDKWMLMTLRVYTPAACALAVAFASMWFVMDWRDNVYLAAFASAARWMPLIAFGAGVALAAWATIRLWLAERGVGLLCACGGLLGAERDGRYGPYRRCLACSQNVAQRHYQ